MKLFFVTQKRYFFLHIPLLMLLANMVIAQPDKSESLQSQKNSQDPNVPVIDDQSVKIFLDKIEVIGRLEKPQAVFIIPGKNPEIDDIRIERSFFNDIFRPVEKKNRSVSKVQNDTKKARKDIIPW